MTEMRDVVLDGPMLTAFKESLQLQRHPLDSETEACSANVVRLLQHHHTSGNRPGMLLGKVQSGKTRAFVGAMAIAFDSGVDLCIVLTKSSKPLATQTIRRLQRDLAPAIEQHRFRVFDAARRLPDLNEWERSRKLALVAKKNPANLGHVRDLITERYPDLAQKRALVIDDEVDFASVGQQRRGGQIQIRSVQALIDAIRTALPEAMYLEVTATPYALYLQPPDIEEPATGRHFRPVRPAFTQLVPEHSGYVGGDFYFDDAREPGSVASFAHVSVSEAELAEMRQPTALPVNSLLSDDRVASLRRALITFVCGGLMRQIDEAEEGRPERLFSFIVHLDRARHGHVSQQTLAQSLIEQLRHADFQSDPIAHEVIDAHSDLCESRSAAGLPPIELEQILPGLGSAFASISTEVVNGDSELERLLDESGQLRQRSPFNIYIGGQSLDRGVTIANVIGFFYGRAPRVAQQDTTIQHCRMYGARPRGDLAITRFYTSDEIYGRMRRMHEFDQVLWEQVRTQQEQGNTNVVVAGDVIFLRRDDQGEVSPCSPNKIMLSKVTVLRPSGERVPYPLSTKHAGRTPPVVGKVLGRLRSLGTEGEPFEMNVAVAQEVLQRCSRLVVVDDGWNFDWLAMREAVRYLAASNPDERRKDCVVGLFTTGSQIEKWRGPGDPQRAPYTRATEGRLRRSAGRGPALAFYHNTGERRFGWSDSEFIWPVLFVPSGIPPVIFDNSRRMRR